MASFLLGHVANADSGVWSPSAIDGDWGNGLNWADGTIPGSISGTTNTDTAVFNGASSVLSVVLDPGRNIQNISFDGAADSYVIGTTAGNPLYLTSGGTAQITSVALGATQTINAPLILGGGYTVANHHATDTFLFRLGGAITSGETTGITTLALDGANTGANLVSGVISNGSGSNQVALSKNGAGLWTLARANTYTGGTTINQGTLRLAFNQAGAPSTNILQSSSSLTIGSSTTGLATLHLQGKALTTNSQTLSGTTIAGNAVISLTAAASNPLLLNLGAITRQAAGVVNFSNPVGTIGANNGITTSTGNTNGILGAWATFNTGWATNDGTNIVPLAVYTNDAWAAGNNTTVTASSAPASGSTTNSLRFNAASPFTVTLSGTNTITSGGILFSSAAGNGTHVVTGGTIVTVPGGEIILSQRNSNSSTRGQISSIIADNGAPTTVIKSGGGELNLFGANTFSGGLILNEGKLKLGAGSEGTGTFTINGGTIGGNGTTFTVPSVWNGNFSNDLGSGYGSVDFGTAGVTLNRSVVVRATAGNSSRSFTVGGAISDGGNGYELHLNAGSSSTALNLVLNGLNTFGGGLTVTTSSGSGATTLTLGNLGTSSASSLGTGTFTFQTGTGNVPLTIASAGGTLGTNNAQVWNGDFAYASSNTLNMGTGAVSLGTVSGTDRTVTVNSATGMFAVGGIISDGVSANSIVKAGPGSLVLSGANAYSGLTTVVNGALRISGADNRLPVSTILATNGAGATEGTFDLNGLNQTVAGISNGAGSAKGYITNSASSSTSTLTVTGTSTYSGTLQNGAGTLALTKSTGGVLVLNGVNTYSGATQITGGTLLINSGSINSSSGVTVNSGKFQYDSATPLSRDVSVNSGGAFAYNSSGTYTGTLSLTSGSVGGNGNLGATPLVFGSNTTLAPGNSPGALTTAEQTWADNGTYRWEINAVAGSGGSKGGTTGWDWTNILDPDAGGSITGDLDISATNGGFTIEIVGLDLTNELGVVDGFLNTSGYTWTIATYEGILTSSFDSSAFILDTSEFAMHNSLGGGSFSIEHDVANKDINLVFTPVPEPTSITLFAGVAALSMVLRRRGRSGKTDLINGR